MVRRGFYRYTLVTAITAVMIGVTVAHASPTTSPIPTCGVDATYVPETNTCKGIGDVGCYRKYASERYPIPSLYLESSQQCVVPTVCGDYYLLDPTTNKCFDPNNMPRATTTPMPTTTRDPKITSPPTIRGRDNCRNETRGTWNNATNSCDCHTGWMTDVYQDVLSMDPENYTWCTLVGFETPGTDNEGGSGIGGFFTTVWNVLRGKRPPTLPIILFFVGVTVLVLGGMCCGCCCYCRRRRRGGKGRRRGEFPEDAFGSDDDDERPSRWELMQRLGSSRAGRLALTTAADAIRSPSRRSRGGQYALDMIEDSQDARRNEDPQAWMTAAVTAAVAAATGGERGGAKSSRRAARESRRRKDSVESIEGEDDAIHRHTGRKHRGRAHASRRGHTRRTDHRDDVSSGAEDPRAFEEMLQRDAALLRIMENRPIGVDVSPAITPRERYRGASGGCSPHYANPRTLLIAAPPPPMPSPRPHAVPPEELLTPMQQQLYARNRAYEEAMHADPYKSYPQQRLRDYLAMQQDTYEARRQREGGGGYYGGSPLPTPRAVSEGGYGSEGFGHGVGLRAPFGRFPNEPTSMFVDPQLHGHGAEAPLYAPAPASHRSFAPSPHQQQHLYVPSPPLSHASAARGPSAPLQHHAPTPTPFVSPSPRQSPTAQHHQPVQEPLLHPQEAYLRSQYGGLNHSLQPGQASMMAMGASSQAAQQFMEATQQRRADDCAVPVPRSPSQPSAARSHQGSIQRAHQQQQQWATPASLSQPLQHTPKHQQHTNDPYLLSDPIAGLNHSPSPVRAGPVKHQQQQQHYHPRQREPFFG